MLQSGDESQRTDGPRMSITHSPTPGVAGTHTVQVDRQTQCVRFFLKGDWTRAQSAAGSDTLAAALPLHGVTCVEHHTAELGEWDSTLLIALGMLAQACNARGITMATDGLPRGVQSLLELARGGVSGTSRPSAPRHKFVARVGVETASLWSTFSAMLAFLGETLVAFARFVRGRAQVRRVDTVQLMRECGANALPIVALVSVLVGVIFAFIGVVQLRQFGVDMYVADLVGIIMIRVMGAVMAGIVLAGRTGSAFAAQIGSMQANDEIDALKVLGISPVEFLVVPRVLALTAMMPILFVFAGVLGVCGGMVVGVHALHLNIIEYINRTSAAVSVADVMVGLLQSIVFGFLVAMMGCYSGLRCARKASAVGDAATSAVVLGIVSIIVATSIITVVFNMLGV
jgi:phospholipid/cholesterol/gamma-HCH transport system permease protein